MKLIFRPGFFGRRRDEIVHGLNRRLGEGKWNLVWVVEPEEGVTLAHEFEQACKVFYERSYFEYFQADPDLASFVCQYKEVYDNAVTNVQSGLDYTKQEAYSTHIQDIAVRNCISRLGLKFDGLRDRLLQIRGVNTEGNCLMPGLVPFYDPKLINPSIRPAWAEPGSVEDFWQSNKWVALKEEP